MAFKLFSSTVVESEAGDGVIHIPRIPTLFVFHLRPFLIVPGSIFLSRPSLYKMHHFLQYTCTSLCARLDKNSKNRECYNSIGLFGKHFVFIQFNGLDWSLLVKHLVIKDIHNSWLYCFTNPLELGTRVSLSHRQPLTHSADDAKAKHVSQVQED